MDTEILALMLGFIAALNGGEVGPQLLTRGLGVGIFLVGDIPLVSRLIGLPNRVA